LYVICTYVIQNALIKYDAHTGTRLHITHSSLCLIPVTQAADIKDRIANPDKYGGGGGGGGGGGAAAPAAAGKPAAAKAAPPPEEEEEAMDFDLFG